MAITKNRRRKKKIRMILCMILILLAVLTLGAAVSMQMLAQKEKGLKKPDELLMTYMHDISEKKYEEMYRMMDTEASRQISKEDFIQRNTAIYEGIEMRNMTVKVLSYDKEKERVEYQTSLDTAAGSLSFENEAFFQKREDGYYLMWDDSLIFPWLRPGDKVKVSTLQAKRGEILDRNGRVLAGEGTASSVGIVPGKMKNSNETVVQMAELLGIKPEEIEKKLAAKWVKEDSFVPVKTLKKVNEIDRMISEPDAEVTKEHERQQKLLQIPGVMISDTSVRAYPLGEAAAHLIGYVQSVTAEDLENYAGEGYTAGSVIGRSGAEGLFESELKGVDGCRIYIVDSDGHETKELASKTVEHGRNIQLTIDADLQRALYEAFREDKSCSVAMDPYTGEVLALVSTPSYDSNDFILGLSGEAWTALNENEDKPLYNRFRQVWCPGSSFKPVTAAIGLESGALNPEEDFGTEGLSWQKDDSWGSYFVTTLHDYEPVVLENALVYSDNIYFAKAALKIGAENMEEGLLHLGFGEELPFEIVMSKSQYSNTENIETEIQLADSGYGQGQILINPLHMACMYSAFCNAGNVIQPYLVYREDAQREYWIANAISEHTAEVVLGGIQKVVNDPHGTGYAAHREDVLLAGKTGTAEIKASKEDTLGTELGWFAVFTPERTAARPILLVSMAEDVKGRGGSGYVVGKTKDVLNQWFDGER